MKIKNVLLIFFVLILSSFGSAVCTNTVTNDGSDFFGVNTTEYVSMGTSFGPDERFKQITAFTPRLNFTIRLNESTPNLMVNGSTFQLKFYNATSIVITDPDSPDLSTPLGAGNYTYNAATSTITIVFDAAGQTAYNNTYMLVIYNRTFVKNVDDLNSTDYNKVCTYCTGLVQLSNPTPWYEENIGFRVTDTDIAGKNWAVVWDVTTTTCTGVSDIATVTGVNTTKTTIFAAFGLLAIILLVTAAFGIVQVFKGDSDGNDIMLITMVLIGGCVVLFIGYIIISYVAQTLLTS